MAEKKVNKVILNGEELINLSEDTVTAAQVAAGVSFHLPNGEQAEGEYVEPTVPTLIPLKVMEKKTYTPDTNQGYSIVTVEIPTWDGSTESLAKIEVTIINNSESLSPMAVGLNDWETEWPAIEVGGTATFEVPIRTVIYIEPSGDLTNVTNPQWVTIKKNDTIDNTGLNSASGTLTINGSGAIELKLQDVGASA